MDVNVEPCPKCGGRAGYHFCPSKVCLACGAIVTWADEEAEAARLASDAALRGALAASEAAREKAEDTAARALLECAAAITRYEKAEASAGDVTSHVCDLRRVAAERWPEDHDCGRNVRFAADALVRVARERDAAITRVEKAEALTERLLDECADPEDVADAKPYAMSVIRAETTAAALVQYQLDARAVIVGLEDKLDAALASNAALRSALETLFAMVKAAQDQEVCRNLVLFAGEMVRAALRDTSGAEMLGAPASPEGA